MTKRRILLLTAVAATCAVAATVLAVVMGRGTSDRPRELAMTAVPPCELISQEDLLGLDVISRPDPGVDLELGEEGTGCRFFARDGTTIMLNEITNYGIDRWTDGDIDDTTFDDVARISGFRVVKVWMSREKDRPDDECKVYIDVADDQSLKVSIIDADRRESSPPVCDVVYRSAEAAMRTLTSR